MLVCFVVESAFSAERIALWTKAVLPSVVLLGRAQQHSPRCTEQRTTLPASHIEVSGQALPLQDKDVKTKPKDG